MATAHRVAMQSKALTISLLLALSSSPLHARIWTDTKGREIEATLVKVDGDFVVMKRKGREIRFAVSKLSEEDRSYLEELSQELEDAEEEVVEETAPGEIKLCGKVLPANGRVTVVEQALSEEAIKKLPKIGDLPSTLKISIALPTGFDPRKPQRVMWVSAPINNEKERKRGNSGSMGAFAGTAVKAGWVVVAVDTDLGNPKHQSNERGTKADGVIHADAINCMKEAWPEFANWQFACCGGSGGAKMSFFRVGQLLAADLNVTGLFLAGCNEDYTEKGRKESRAKRSGIRKIKAWISNGKKDTISTPGHASSLAKNLKGHRYGAVRLALFDGGHKINKDEFAKAIEWFMASEES